MSEQNIGAQTQEAGRAIAYSRIFEADAAKLVISNLFIAVSNLTPKEFAQLPVDSVDLTFDTVACSRKVTDISPEDKAQNPSESREAYTYRLSVSQPLFALFRKLHTEGADTVAPDRQNDIRKAVMLAGAAFAGIMETAGKNPNIARFDEVLSRNAREAQASVKN